MAEVLLHEGSPPGTPSTGVVSVYAQTNGRVYSKDAAGVEVPLSATVVRVVAIPDGVTLVPNADTTDIAYQTNTQASGTVTIQAPLGAPTPRQKLMLIVDCLHAQATIWNGMYRAAPALPLPIALSPGPNYFGFVWHPTAVRWDLLAVLQSF